MAEEFIESPQPPARRAPGAHHPRPPGVAHHAASWARCSTCTQHSGSTSTPSSSCSRCSDLAHRAVLPDDLQEQARAMRRRRVAGLGRSACTSPGATRSSLPSSPRARSTASSSRRRSRCWCSKARGAWPASRSSPSRSRAWCTRCSATTCPACSRRGRSTSPGCWSTSASTPTRCSALRCRSRSSWWCRSSCSATCSGAAAARSSSPTSRAPGWAATAAARRRSRWSARPSSA